MYYVHFDNNGRPDSFTGFKSRSLQKAISYCKEIESYAHVTKEIKVFSPFHNAMADGFTSSLFCNFN